MSLHFLSAKIRGGKSRHAMDFIWEELVYGNRVIVTNLAVKLPELYQLLRQRAPKAFERRYVLQRAWQSYQAGDCSINVDRGMLRHISDDVILISDSEVSRFFTIRGNGVRIEHIENEDWKRGKRPDYSVVNDLGVLYVLDEIHLAFNSREWTRTGAEVLYYVSQHGKLSDTIIAITQQVGNVDSQFRGLAQDYTYVTNLSKKRIGKFRLPSKFVWMVYDHIPTRVGTDTPMDTGFFDLDRDGLANCYDTAKGIGIHGRAGADMNERKKGFHWAWFVLLAGMLIFLVFKVAPGFLARHFVPGLNAPAAPPQVFSASSAPVAAENAGDVRLGPVVMFRNPLRGRPSGENPSDSLQTEDYSGVTFDGYVKNGNSITVFLSDGTVADSSEGTVGIVARQYAVVNGIRYPARRLRNLDLPSTENNFDSMSLTERRTVDPASQHQLHYRNLESNVDLRRLAPAAEQGVSPGTMQKADEVRPPASNQTVKLASEARAQASLSDSAVPPAGTSLTRGETVHQ